MTSGVQRAEALLAAHRAHSFAVAGVKVRGDRTSFIPSSGLMLTSCIVQKPYRSGRWSRRGKGKSIRRAAIKARSYSVKYARPKSKAQA